MLDEGGALPHRPRRILLAGVSGVGKTTLASRLAALTGSPHVEIDALYHGPNWTYRESFLDDVRELAEQPAWVTEWQYASARPILVAAADTLVWLDHPTRVALPRLIRRTIRRRVRREVLWNGNVEGPLWKFFTGRDHIIWWAIRSRGKYDRIIPALTADTPDLAIVRLASDKAVERWLRGPLAAALRE